MNQAEAINFCRKTRFHDHLLLVPYSYACSHKTTSDDTLPQLCSWVDHLTNRSHCSSFKSSWDFCSFTMSVSCIGHFPLHSRSFQKAFMARVVDYYAHHLPKKKKKEECLRRHIVISWMYNVHPCLRWITSLKSEEVAVRFCHKLLGKMQKLQGSFFCSFVVVFFLSQWETKLRI